MQNTVVLPTLFSNSLKKILRRDVDLLPITNTLKGSEYNKNKFKLF